MNSKLVYKGESPIHAFKTEWTPNKELPLTRIFDLVGKFCRGSSSVDYNFVKWLQDSLSQKPPGFSLVIDPKDFNSDLPTKLVGKESVESSVLEVSSSEDHALKSLSTKRKRKKEGEVTTTKTKSLSDGTMNSKVKLALETPPPGSQVMSGDDLASARRLNSSVVGSAVVLNPSTDEGGNVIVESKRVSPISPEYKKMMESRMAEVNHGSKVLKESDIPRSQVVTSHTPVDESNKPQHHIVKDGDKFQAFSQQGITPREITADDIARNPDESNAIQLINQCRNINTLKVARLSCYKQDKQRLMREIDARVDKLPPRSM